MKEFFSKNGGLLFAIAFLLTILIGATSVILQGSTDPISNAMGVLTTPFRSVSATVTIWAEGVYDFVTTYQEQQGTITSLEKEVADLEEKVREGEEALRENAQLRELLSLQARRKDFVFESAKVTARSFTGWESTISLNKGNNAGIALGDCVVTETGDLVGVVSELGENWCTVSTIISTDISMGGLVFRTYSAGVLEGDFSLMAQGQLRLSYLPEDAQLVAGDQVLTAGMGDIYPGSLTVGKILGVFSDPSGMSRYAVVEPDVDLTNLIEVFIIKDFDVID